MPPAPTLQQQAPPGASTAANGASSGPAPLAADSAEAAAAAAAAAATAANEVELAGEGSNAGLEAIIARAKEAGHSEEVVKYIVEASAMSHVAGKDGAYGSHREKPNRPGPF